MSNPLKKIFPIIFGLIIYSSIRLVNDVISEWKFWERPLLVNITEIVGVIVFSYLFDAIIRYFLKKNLETSKAHLERPRLGKEFLEVGLYLEFTFAITLLPFAAVTDDGLQWYDVVNLTIIPLLYCLLYYAIARVNQFMKMSYEQQIQIEKIVNEQLKAELKFLKAQVHPHFLFNALNTIYFQMDENILHAKHTVEKLSELLRYQLYDQSEKVAIGQELDYLQSYIDLQKVRMNENLVLNVSLDPLLKEQKIYPLLMLPIVENAFKYAGGAYWIHIEATLTDAEQLIFKVSNSIPDYEPKRKDGGIGIENLKRRLEILYAGKYRFEINKTDKYFETKLQIKLDHIRSKGEGALVKNL
jgi:two-component system, LytTR family, sensor kinase